MSAATNAGEDPGEENPDPTTTTTTTNPPPTAEVRPPGPTGGMEESKPEGGEPTSTPTRPRPPPPALPATSETNATLVRMMGEMLEVHRKDAAAHED
eukprot:CAMPEP_0118917586 /NCGR_PEP_ID=MMETSP1166-20130328/17414_1 /TAXON_ID=1104430 /ORGANISM="Chrysoreinhardia sp, Strain CCMP3193" /LENGTH=96 /DNA_ID=CAMNT_0006857779 /DNA_START=271 /DNA_END=558 /DNA_ORIENTATION=+